VIFEKKDDILDRSFVSGAGAMSDKWRRHFQAGQAEMWLSRPLEKSAADQAIGQRAGPQFFPAAPADNSFGRPFEKGMADFTPGRIK
jgi:hypothetical protein